MINDEEETEISNENSYYIINPNSEEYKTVEFHLKSSISGEVHIEKVISVKNILTYNQFEFLSNTHLWSYGWYNLKGYDYEKSMKEFREKSFNIPPCGAHFLVGSIFDISNSTEVQSVFVLCKIIIGKSFCKIKTEGEKETPPLNLEPPYESYMYCSLEQSAKSQKTSWSMTKPYSYYIKNKNFIEPLYTVFFTRIDDSFSSVKCKYMCVQCKNKEATFYCQNCVNYYCSECINLVHLINTSESNIKNVFQHKDIVKINNITRPGFCCYHPENESEYYCDECKKCICGYCKFKGSHSKGQQSQHNTEDLYKTLDKTINNYTAWDDNKKNGVISLKKIKDMIINIDQKMIQSQNEIDKDFEIHKKTMNENSKICKNEVFEFISNLREIKRNMLYFHKYFKERENFLKENKNYSELSFIWSIHEEIINEYFKNFEELKKVDLTKYSEKLTINFPFISISKENFGFNKMKVQTEINNKRNVQKNDGFQQRQKDENYNIIDKTRELMIKLRKLRKKNFEKIAEEKIKEKIINENMILRKENDEFESIEKDTNLDENNTTINTNIELRKNI